MRWLALLLTALLAGAAVGGSASAPAASFADRGYYLTFMRMPTFGHAAWRRALDGFRDDGADLLILWAAGGFRSRKFPETWEYNRDHANVRADFLRALIDDAHARGIRVLLGFSPFGYDGVNRMSLARPEWRATGPDGQSVRRFGIHCWIYNLCPARDDTQQFMIDYARELAFDFYPNADGLFIEASDYAACHCPRSGDRYFHHEHRFVRAISEEV